MSNIDMFLLVVAGLSLLLLVAALFIWQIQRRKAAQQIAELAASAEVAGSDRLEAADAGRRRETEWMQSEVERIRSDSEKKLAEQLRELSDRRGALEDREADLHRREDDLSSDYARLRSDLEDARRNSRRLEQLAVELDQREAELDQREAELVRDVERVGGMTGEQARAQVLSVAEREANQQALDIRRTIIEEAKRDAEKTARDVVAATIQRIAVEQTSEAVVSTVELPSEELKGRIIGREGRNIRAFEQITGVNVMIDDTPGSVLVSCFDPVRRETARVALVELIADGRIQPARIEEVYERSKTRVLRSCQQAAEDALTTLGIANLRPELVELVGTLRYRASYGQNVLEHMVECGRIAGALAAELGLNPASCVRAAFLHDIGKAIVTNGEGSHAAEGAVAARRYGEPTAIVNAIASHHNEVPVETVEAVLTQIADTISGSRPGARRESIEAYVHRLERLEEIASSHPGVDRVFAMQAGREVRVMVSPNNIDDAGSAVLAQAIARQVENELTYPGNIRITVVRESRATEIAR